MQLLRGRNRLYNSWLVGKLESGKAESGSREESGVRHETTEAPWFCRGRRPCRPGFCSGAHCTRNAVAVRVVLACL
jgi:hypothetical protein